MKLANTSEPIEYQNACFSQSTFWSRFRIKYLLREIDNRSKTGTEPLLSMRQGKGLIPHNDVSPKRFKNEDLIGYKIVSPGQLVMNRMRASIGLFAASYAHGLVSPDYAVFQPLQPLNLEYLVHLFRTPHMGVVFRQESKGMGTGTSGFLRLYTDRFGAISILTPPFELQNNIVKVIDLSENKISKFISNKRRLIELLAERREVATHNAIKLKRTRKLRLEVVADRVERPINRQENEVYTPIGLFNRGRGIFHKQPTKGTDLGDSIFFWVKEGDLVLSGQFAWEGAVALAGQDDTDCIASHRYPILRGKPNVVESAYLLSFFKTGLGHLLLDQHSRGAAGRNRPLNARTLMKEKIPIPPLHVQQYIKDLVHLENKLIQTVSKQIELLREYRTRLISDVVTGKVDVRGIEVPELSDDELPPLEEETTDPDDMIADQGEMEGEE